MNTSMIGSRGPTGSGTGFAATGKVKIPGYNVNQLPNFTPEMMQLFQSLFSHVSPDSYLSRLAGGDQELFNQIEAPALKQFSGLQGNLASRFSGMGMGARNSSGFQNTMNQAASDFAQSLQSNRQQMMQQAIQELMNLSGNLLQQRPYETFVTPKPQRSSSGLGGLFGSAIGGIGGLLSGGPAGALGGARLGYNIGSAF